MAVYGQVFQTPAAVYTPFTLWALLSFPFAAGSRSLAHWTVWLVVACVAILSYAHEQIVLNSGREALVWVYGGMSFAFLVLVIVYDRVQSKWPGWARAAWFRLALIAACMAFAVTAIGAGFWQDKIAGSALVAIAIGGGAFAYLYRYKQQSFANPPLARVPCLVIALSGLALMVAEAFAPSFGILGLGGVIAFVIGSIMLMDTEAPGYGISWALIGGLAATSAVLLSLVLGMAVRSRNCPVVSGHEQMLESTGVALENFSLTDSTYTGTVRVHSEHWQAHSNTPLRKGDSVRVTTMSGLVLTVVTDAPSDGIPILGEPLDKS